MIVFKTFLKVLNKCKVPIIMYTAILIFFGGFNMQTSDNNISFEATKPDVLIVNNDEDKGITNSLISYIEDNSNIIDIKEDEASISDALFYRDVNYIIYIPKNYRQDVLNGKNPNIEIKSTGDYNASLAEMMLTRYLSVMDIYKPTFLNEEEVISKINNTLAINTEVEVTSKLDTNNLSKASFYYNFMNYSMLAGSIYVVCLILSSFKEEKIRKRTIVSSMDYKKYNRYLMWSNSLFAFILWLIYVMLGFILIGEVMFSWHGAIYIINSFVFSFCALTIAFFIGNIISDKNAINGIINVIALGSSFLCGAFVPVEFLPNSVLTIAHILPSYWYINTNEVVKSLEVINIDALKPVLINVGVLIIFSIVFIVINNIVSKRKSKID